MNIAKEVKELIVMDSTGPAVVRYVRHCGDKHVIETIQDGLVIRMDSLYSNLATANPDFTMHNVSVTMNADGDWEFFSLSGGKQLATSDEEFVSVGKEIVDSELKRIMSGLGDIPEELCHDKSACILWVISKACDIWNCSTKARAFMEAKAAEELAK